MDSPAREKWKGKKGKVEVVRRGFSKQLLYQIFHLMAWDRTDTQHVHSIRVYQRPYCMLLSFRHGALLSIENSGHYSDVVLGSTFSDVPICTYFPTPGYSSWRTLMPPALNFSRRLAAASEKTYEIPKYISIHLHYMPRRIKRGNSYNSIRGDFRRPYYRSRACRERLCLRIYQITRLYGANHRLYGSYTSSGLGCTTIEVHVRTKTSRINIGISLGHKSRKMGI